MFPNAGPIDLDDSGGNALPHRAAARTRWPGRRFRRARPGRHQHPDQFNLLVVYNPSVGRGRSSYRSLVEQFIATLTLANVAATSRSTPALIAVRSFPRQPNPGLSAYALMHYDANQAPARGHADELLRRPTRPPGRRSRICCRPGRPTPISSSRSSPTARRICASATTPTGSRRRAARDFTATYRVGNGTAGNVGAESLVFLATGDARIVACTNPLPAIGGVDPETTDQIRRRAPQAFLTQERAVTMPDYEAIAERNTQIDEAVATLRWTGSWYTVFIAAEPKGGGNLTPRAAQVHSPVRQPLPPRRAGPQLESPQLCLARDRADGLRRSGLLPARCAQRR